MLLKYKSFKIKVPPKQGDPPHDPGSILEQIGFSEETERKSMLASMGIDPNLSDDELAEYKTMFTTKLTEVSLTEVEQDIPVVDYIKKTIEDKVKDLKTVDDQIQEEYNQKYNKWKNGYDYVKTIQVSNDDSICAEQVAKIEGYPNFIEWVDEYVIEEVDVRDVVCDDIEMEAFKVGEKFVLCLPREGDDLFNESQIKVLADENDMDWKRVKVDDIPAELGDSVMSIYQFIEYVDLQKDNVQRVIRDMVVDEDQTNIDNIALGNPDYSAFNDAFSPKARMENFEENDVFSSINDILKND